METKELTNEEALRKILSMSRDIHRVDKLGGRDSFFGMMEIFEIILKEEHEKDPNEPHEGMYRFKGMEQYGNIVSPDCVYSTVKRCVETLKFTKDEFDQLIKWYKYRDSIDCVVLHLTIKWAIKDLNYFQDNK